jgi:hypothetical protein
MLLSLTVIAAAVELVQHAESGGSGDILATAPPTVTVSGLSCHPDSNAAYGLQPKPLNGKPHWATEDGASHVYWTPDFAGSGSTGWMIGTNIRRWTV